MSQSFQDLVVWQRAVEMTIGTYPLTRNFLREEIYGLSSQMRRAAVSVASNIAEGRGRMTDGECRQVLGNAQGSNYELQTQIEVARRLKFAPEKEFQSVDLLSTEVGKMLSALIATIGLKQKK